MYLEILQKQDSDWLLKYFEQFLAIIFFFWALSNGQQVSKKFFAAENDSREENYSEEETPVIYTVGL